MIRSLHYSLMIICCVAAIVACDVKLKAVGDDKDSQGTPEPPAGLSSCPADPQWVLDPTLPSEVANPQSTCSFEQFMWQSMLALVQPSQSHQEGLVFETWMPSYGIFVAAGTPTAWGQQPPDPCSTPSDKRVQTGTAPRFYSNIVKQAGADQPLTDVHGNLVYYGMSVNQDAYDMLTSCELYKAHCAGPLKPHNTGIDLIGQYPNLAFPNHAVELKTSWMVLSPQQISDGLFYTVPGWIQEQTTGACHLVTLGLTGMHIVSKTPNFPALLWATFEHRNNAPDCDNTAAAPPLGGSWNFYDPTCVNCPTNTYQPGRPAQVCRMHPQGDSHIGTFPAGADCQADPNQFACQDKTVERLEASTQAIKALNTAVEKLIRDHAKAIDTVWANYALVGNVWTTGATTPPYLQAQRGSLSAANTSMETFVQNGVANVTNPYSCFSCHHMEGPTAGRTLPPVGLSHLFQHIAMPGGCSDGTLPAACKPYYTNP